MNHTFNFNFIDHDVNQMGQGIDDQIDAYNPFEIGVMYLISDGASPQILIMHRSSAYAKRADQAGKSRR